MYNELIVAGKVVEVEDQTKFEIICTLNTLGLRPSS